MSKKIIPIISLSVIAILVLTTIILAVVQKDYEPISIKSTEIVVVADNGNKRSYSNEDGATKEDKEIYNNIVNYYEEAFKETAINALFRGRTNYTPTIKYIDTVKKVSSLSSKRLEFYFNEEQKFTYNAKEYSYDVAVIEMISTNVMETVNVYFYKNGENFEADSSSNEGTHYYMTTIGNINKLVSYINEIRE